MVIANCVSGIAVINWSDYEENEQRVNYEHYYTPCNTLYTSHGIRTV